VFILVLIIVPRVKGSTIKFLSAVWDQPVVIFARVNVIIHILDGDLHSYIICIAVIH